MAEWTRALLTAGLIALAAVALAMALSPPVSSPPGPIRAVEGATMPTPIVVVLREDPTPGLAVVLIATGTPYPTPTPAPDATPDVSVSTPMPTPTATPHARMIPETVLTPGVAS